MRTWGTWSRRGRVDAGDAGPGRRASHRRRVRVLGATARPRRSTTTRRRSASGCSSRVADIDRTRRRGRLGRDRHRPADQESGRRTRCRRSSIRARTTRPRSAVATRASAWPTHERRRDAQRPLPAVLRQLLRPARLRVHPRPGQRHGVLDRLRAPRRPERHRRLQVRRRLAQRPRDGATQVDQHSRSEEVGASWHNGSSAMIGKSYDGTLSNGVAATGVEGLKTIVPDLGDLRLVQLLAHRRRPPQHELPGEPRTTPASRPARARRPA